MVTLNTVLMIVVSVLTVVSAIFGGLLLWGRWIQRREGSEETTAKDISNLRASAERDINAFKASVSKEFEDVNEVLVELKKLLAIEHEKRREEDEKLDKRFDARIRDEYASRRESEERFNVLLGRLAERLATAEERLGNRLVEAERDRNDMKVWVSEMRTAVADLQKLIYMRGGSGV